MRLINNSANVHLGLTLILALFIASVATSAGDTLIVISAQTAHPTRCNRFKLWLPLTGSEETQTDIPVLFGGIAWGGRSGLVLRPDGKLVASAQMGGEILLWEIDNLQIIKTTKSDYAAICSLCLSANDRLASGNHDGSIRVWDINGLPVILFSKFSPLMSPVLSVSFNADASLLISGERAGLISIWDIATSVKLAKFRVLDPANSVLFSHDDHLFFAGLRDGTVELWNSNERSRHPNSMQVPGAPVKSLAYSPDKNILVSGTFDGQITVWDLRTFQLLRTMKGHEGPIHFLDFTSDGSEFVSGTMDSSEVKRWSLQTHKQIDLFTHEGETRLLAYGHEPILETCIVEEQEERLAYFLQQMDISYIVPTAIIPGMGVFIPLSLTAALIQRLT